MDIWLLISNDVANHAGVLRVAGVNFEGEQLIDIDSVG